MIIAFFGLNRDGLQAQRAESLIDTWSQFLATEGGDAISVEALKRKCSERGEFSSCARRFLEICKVDRAAAEALVIEARTIMELWLGE